LVKAVAKLLIFSLQLNSLI